MSKNPSRQTIRRDVLRLLKQLSADVLEEMAVEDEWAARIKASFDEFQALALPNQQISELAAMLAREL